MNKYIKIITIILFCGLFSCNENEVFEKEQYKNVFALVSGSDNISTWVHDLRKTESEGYVSASLGGTKPTTEDIRITLVGDDRLIDNYNNVAYDVNTTRYIMPLAPGKYTIDNYSFTILKGEVKASIPVKVRPDGLSPDSSYFIALRVDTYSAYEVNPQKDYLLYRVQIKNWWCATGGTTYNQRGNYITTGSTQNPIQIFGTKRLYPLTEKRVRLLGGIDVNDTSNENIFNLYSFVMNIGDDNKITIEPYKTLDIKQIDGDIEFPNRVVLENDGFKTYKKFLLHYTYTSSNGTNYTIKEELRLEYKEDPKDPRFLTN